MIKDQLKKIPNQISNVLTYIRDMIKDAFNGFVDIIKQIFQPFLSFREGFNESIEASTGSKDDNTMFFNKVVFGISLALFLIFAGKVFKSVVLSPLLFLAITSIDIFKGALTNMRTSAMWQKVFPSQGEHEAQSFSLASVMSIATLSIGMVSLRDTATIVALLQKMPDITKSVSSWSTWFVDKCFIFFTDKPFFLDTEQKDALKAYCDELIEFYREPDNKKNMLSSEPIGRNVRRLGRAAPGWKTALSALRGLDNHWYNHMSTLMNNIMTDAELVRTTGIAVTQRCEPVVLFLHGMGGQGKGASMQLFPKAVYEVVSKHLPHIYPDRWNPTMSFTKAKGSDFWEGYDQNFCVIHDEMLAQDDPTKRGEECVEFLNIVDTNPLSLNMAFGAKGQNYFTSPFVIVATNIKENELETACGMTAPPSFKRRRHVNVTVTRNENVQDVLTNEAYQRAWTFTEYLDKSTGSVQPLALQDQVLVECEHGRYCAKSHCTTKRCTSYYDILKKDGVITCNFLEVVQRVGLEIVRRHKTTSNLRQRLADHEFFPELKYADDLVDEHPFGVKDAVKDSKGNVVLYKYPYPKEQPEAQPPVTLEYEERTLPKPVIITNPFVPPHSHNPFTTKVSTPSSGYTFTLPTMPSLSSLIVNPFKSMHMSSKTEDWVAPEPTLPDHDVPMKPAFFLSQPVQNPFATPLPGEATTTTTWPPNAFAKPFVVSNPNYTKDNGAGVGFEGLNHVAQGWMEYQCSRNDMVMDDELRQALMEKVSKTLLVDVVADDNIHFSNPARLGQMFMQWFIPTYFGSVNEFDSHPGRKDYEAVAVMLYGTVEQISTHLYNEDYKLLGAKEDDCFSDRMIAKIFEMSHSPSYKTRKQCYQFLLELLMLKRLRDNNTVIDFEEFEKQAPSESSSRLFKMLQTYTYNDKCDEVFNTQFVVQYFHSLFFDKKFNCEEHQFFLTSEFGHWKARFDAINNKSTQVWRRNLQAPSNSFIPMRLLLKSWSKEIKRQVPNTKVFEMAQSLKRTDSFSEWIQSQYYYTTWRNIAIAVGALLGAGIAWYFLRERGTEATGDVSQVNFEMDDDSKTKLQTLLTHDPQSLSKGFQARLRARQKVLHHQAQGLDSDVLSESVMSQINEISNNMRTLTFHYSEKPEQSTVAFFSGRRAFLFNHFFLVAGMDFDRVTVSNDAGVCSVINSNFVKVTMPNEEKDCAYVDFSHKVFGELPSCRKRFESMENIKSAIEHGYYKISRLHRQKKGSTVVNYLAGGSKLCEADAPSSAKLTTLTGETEVMTITDYMLVVGSKGDPGHCSLPYVAVDMLSGNVFVVGFHIGRVGDDSLINVLTEADLPRTVAYEAQGKFVYQQGLYMPPHVVDNLSHKRRQEYDGRLVSMGSLKRPSMIPSETNLIPSPFQGDSVTPPIYPVETAPALLKPTLVEQDDGGVVQIQPLQNAIKKIISAPVREVDPAFVEFMEKEPEHAFRGFFPNVRRDFRLLTKVEAIQSLDMQASISYWGKVNGFTSREQMFDKLTGWIHPKLDSAIDEVFVKMDQGFTLKQAMEACLKDETRDLPRVYAGKTRLFYVGCLVHLIVTIMVMGDMVNFMKAHRGTSDVCIGINPHGNEWEFLKKKLNSVPGGKFFAGDYSNFDTSITHVFGYGFYLAFSWYSQWYVSQARQNWYLYCICIASVGPILIITVEVYFMNWANGSGQWNTGTLNSFANCLVFNWFYRVIVVNKGKSCSDFADLLVSFQKYIRLAVYGDDNMGSVHPRLQSIFTMPRISKFIFEVFGMTYTTPSKELVDKDFLDWDELDFLCRKFYSNSGTHAPLSLDSIHGMVLWIRKPQRGVSIEQQLAINVEQACMEFYHYGRDTFEREKVRLFTYCRKYGIPFTAKTYDEYHQRFADGILFC